MAASTIDAVNNYVRRDSLMNDLKKIFSYAKPYKRDFAVAVILVCIETVFEMIIPLLMTDIVDIGVPSHDIGILMQQGGKMAVCAALSLIS